MEPPLFRAAEAAVARRDDATAYTLLRRILLEHPSFAPAWISMSNLVTDVVRQRECLERALALDPQNTEARDRLEQMRIKGLLGSVSHVERATRRPVRRKLGDFLVESGVITAGQLRAALGEQALRRRGGEAIQLGELLLQLGLVTPEALAHALVEQTLAWIPAQQQGWANEAHSIERLGDYLIAEQLITPAQLEAALVEQICLAEQGRPLQLGQILVRQGCLPARCLEDILARQRREFFSKFGE
jgi:hypothetical protein